MTQSTNAGPAAADEFPNATDRLLAPEQASDTLGFAVQTLARWRVEGKGPAYLKLGRRIRYSTRAIQQWLAGHAKTSTSS